MKNEPIVIEHTYHAPIDKVWNAITDKNKMKLWYFDLEDFKPEVGYEFTFEGGSENKTYLHICRVTDVIIGNKLTHSWRYDGYKGNSYVTWELFSEDDNTRVKLTHKGLETFPETNPDFAKSNFEQGWTSILGTSLKEYLEKQ